MLYPTELPGRNKIHYLSSRNHPWWVGQPGPLRCAFLLRLWSRAHLPVRPLEAVLLALSGRSGGSRCHWHFDKSTALTQLSYRDETNHDYLRAPDNMTVRDKSPRAPSARPLCKGGTRGDFTCTG